MSAWMLDKDHFDLLVTAAVEWGLETPRNATAAGRMLIETNVRSMKVRYGTADGGERLAREYEFERYPGAVDPEVVSVACSCLDYQSCEFDAWRTTESCQWLTDLTLAADTRLPAWVERFGAIDPSRQAEGRRDVYVLVDELGRREVRCSAAWPVEDRGVFERIAALRTNDEVAPA